VSGQPDLLQGASAEELQQLLEADESLPEAQRRWPQELSAILRVLEASLLRAGVDAPRAFSLAAGQVADLAAYRGGRMLYLPQGRRLRTALRDAAIWREFNGKNVEELAEKHRLTSITVYEILREQRALNTRRVQPQLFETPP
jgi:Mor family transcriptional regulator